MSDIVCYHCFTRFPVRGLHFRCPHHKPAYDFPWQPGRFETRPPQFAACPEDHLLTGFRVCPNRQCRRVLPYYVGRSPQRIIAVAGWRTSGKTVYMASLLYRLRERLAADPDPYAVAMFEDDEGAAAYARDRYRLIVQRQLPEGTQMEGERGKGDIAPTVVRMLRRGESPSNLVFYDPAGEFFESLEHLRYLKYVSAASAIIYLVSAPTGYDDLDADALDKAADGLVHLAQRIREELQLPRKAMVPQALAVALTKCDRAVFPQDGPEELVAGWGEGPDFWRSPARARPALLRASNRCQEVLRRFGNDNLVNIAEANYAKVSFFAVSSLGHSPDEETGDLTAPPEPLGVENPLFWSMQSVG